MIDEDVSLGLGVSDCATVMRHGFIGRVGIIELCRRSIQLLTLASLITMFASRQASIHFCRFLMYSTGEAVAVADLCSDVWIDPRFRFLTWFGSSNMKWGWKFEDVVKQWDTDGNIRLFWKLLHSWFNLVGKGGPVDAIASTGWLADDEGNWQIVWAVNRFC